MRQNSQRFCQLIKQELDSGFGFTPFIGSGLSVLSGIPTGQEILDYLAFCISDVIDRRWNPRKDRWPDLIKSKKGEERNQWIKETIDSVQNLPKSGGNTYDSRLSVIKMEAIGALSNWRTALHFLSRFDVQEDCLVLGAPDARVVDSFFLNLTRNRRPNAAHIMLAHLATAMRIRIVLTTNFDTLIEEAFAGANFPIVAFDVHSEAGLPDPDLVLAQGSIIKLHGGRYGLRADFSLDELPSENDKAAFVGYLSVSSRVNPDIKVMQNHLFVLGSSGNDKRTLKLMEATLKHDANLKVFWVCYDVETEKRVQEYFAGTMPDTQKNRIYTIIQQETDLFLFDLYQRLTLSLPPAGGAYPAFWVVPPYPYKVQNSNTKRNFDKNREKFIGKLKELTVSNHGGTLAVYGGGGVSSIASSVFEEFSTRYICIWLDLARYYGEEHLFAMMTSAIAQKLGVPFGVPITLGTQHEHYREEFAYYVNEARKPIILFLNGRDGPDFLKCNERAETSFNDWESDAWYPQHNDQLEKKRINFWKFIHHIQLKNIVFVVLLRKPDNIPRPDSFTVDLIELPGLSIDFETDQVVANVISWLNLFDGLQKERRTRFVYSLSLFRYAIHLAASCSWALIKAPEQCRFDNEDNDTIRAQFGETWLKELDRRGAVRRRPGGFVWIHEEVRIGLQEKLSDTCMNMKAECHEGIADWYAKLFRSSNDPCAALESLRHRMYCVTAKNCGEDSRHHAAFIEAVNMLKLARNRILSSGYSRAFAAAVERIYETCKSYNPIKPELSYKLQQACLEIQRDLFRELADFPKELEVLEKQRIDSADANHDVGRDDTTPEEPDLNNKCVSHYADISGRSAVEQHCPPLEYSRFELEYEEAVAQTGLRLYDDAEKSLIALIERLYKHSNGSLPDSLKLPETYSRPTIEEIRKTGRQWIARAPDDPIRKLMVRTIRRYMFLLMLKAQLIALQESKIKEGIFGFASRSHIDKYQILLKKAEAFYCLATELMRYISDHKFLQKENALIRTHYGVLLGNMQRFYEARRRLNEASAYLKQSGESPDSISWAIIDLRRVEVYLVEACDLVAQWIKKPGEDPTSNAWRQCVAITNDAQTCLDRARSKMEGHRKNVWWWTWSYQLQISICVIISRLKTRIFADTKNVRCWNKRQTENLGLVCQSCDGNWKKCRDLFSESMRLIMLDPLRQARLIELFLFLLDDKRLSPDGDTLKQGDRDTYNSLWGHLDNVLQQRKAKGCGLDSSFEEYHEKLKRYHKFLWA